MKASCLRKLCKVNANVSRQRKFRVLRSERTQSGIWPVWRLCRTWKEIGDFNTKYKAMARVADLQTSALHSNHCVVRPLSSKIFQMHHQRKVKAHDKQIASLKFQQLDYSFSKNISNTEKCTKIYQTVIIANFLSAVS